MEQWSRDGVPENPRAWLVSAGRFKGIDSLRRRTKFGESQAELVRRQNGDIVLLEDQERSLWNRELIGEAVPLIHCTLTSESVGPYTIQAAISAVHAEFAAAYRQALSLARQEPERRYLERRLREVG